MIIKASKLASSRRQFLKSMLPAGTLLCFGCSNLFAIPIAIERYKDSTQKHKFLEDSGMTIEEVFRFSAQGSVPIMQNLAKIIGKEKFLEMLEKASAELHSQIVLSRTKDLPKKDLGTLADYMITTLESFPFNKAVTYEIVERTDEVFEIKYTECLIANVYREMRASDIGYVLHCYPSYPAWRAFNQKIKAIHPKTLMQGHDVCIERYSWEG